MFDESQPHFQALAQIVSQGTRPLLAWIGAGLSRPAGLPSWSGLREQLCNVLDYKARSMAGTTGESLLGRLRAARDQENFWLAFRILRDALGHASYQSTIREALREAPRAEIPSVYETLWKLRLTGILNLNLDKIATRAFVKVHGAKPVTEFRGRDTRNYARVLGDTIPFIANLHGTYEDSSSWVFTDDELKQLSETPGYSEFLTACIMTRTIIFAGISANDVAAGGHLSRLSDPGIDFTTHFWITDRTDQESDDWAERAGLLLIRYKNPDGSHTELKECVESLLRAIPEEPHEIPVRPSEVTPVDSMPKPDEIVGVLDPEEIRQILNGRAVGILAKGTEDAYREYERFCEAYDEAIHRAWYIPRVLGKHKLMGYRLIKVIASGGFGTVYEAESPDGSSVAIKLLHEAVRSDPKHLQSFRRGVRSMSILTAESVLGVVRHFDQCEIPAFAVMEYIPGGTLESVLKRRHLDWPTILEIASRLASIFLSSHMLPARVLHRDIRPTNIMFKQQWEGDEDWEIVVLDFDLSYHKDSEEKTIVMESYSGYLAPEQVERNPRYSTRNALVDSYGLGMTLYSLLTRQNPAFLQPAQAGWANHLYSISQSTRCKTWHSLPSRYTRLIQNCTRIDQHERWDMTQIKNELERLKQVVLGGGTCDSAELLAEEIASRAFQGRYLWDPDRFMATFAATDESKVSLTGHEASGNVMLRAGWIQTGKHHRGDTKKWTNEIGAKIAGLLDRLDWSIQTNRQSSNELVVEAEIPVERLWPQLTEASEVVRRVNDMMIRH